MQILDELVTAAVTLLVVVAALMVAGVVIVARRRGRPNDALDAVRRSAGSALVRADDRVDDAESDIDFALAQFGENAMADYRAALQQARSDRDEVFRLHRMLENEPGARLRHRERAERIVMLADRIERTLDEQSARFRERRSLETAAPERLEQLVTRIAAARAALADARTARDALLERADRSAIGAPADAPERAAEQLERAEARAAQATTQLAGAAASAVTTTIGEAELLLHTAEQAIASVGTTAARLDAAAEALQQLRDDARAARTEALEAVDGAADAGTADAITAAIAETDAAIATAAGAGSRDALRAIAGIRAALDGLDVSLAAGRTQTQRLSHARAAYQAALVQVEAQIAAARAAIAGRGSAGARSRLDDALGELDAARTAIGSDPVEALDAARRALMHARDAEVLARY